MDIKLRISIDGGAATGKSTVSRLVSKKLGLKYINTGQMYRLFGLVAIRNNLTKKENELSKMLEDIKISYNDEGNIISNFTKFTLEQLNSPEVGDAASKVSSMPQVRKIATLKQKEIAEQKGILMEGRDIASIIMPNADFKFYLKVEPEIAAHRRFVQAKGTENEKSEDEILNLIKDRNKRDKNREIAPLVILSDSIVFDTSKETAEQISDKIVGVING